MNIIGSFLDIEVLLFLGIWILFLVGYSWTTWTSSDQVVEEIVNVIQEEKMDRDGAIQATGTIKWKKGADKPSNAALDLGTLEDGNMFDVTGTDAITSITTIAIGTWVCLQFDGILTFTHDAVDLILPGAANITTAAGDVCIMHEYDTGKWLCVAYTKADGTGVIADGAVSPRDSALKTDDYTIQDSEGGYTFTMQAAAIEKTFTLPSAAAAGKGFWVKCLKGQAGKLNVDPVGTDFIGDGGNGDPIYNDNANEAGIAFIILEVNYDENGWDFHGQGEWTTTD